MSKRSSGRATERWLLSSGDERRLLLCHGGHAASNSAVNIAFATTFIVSTTDRDARSLTEFLIFALLPFALLAPAVGVLAERFALCAGRTLRNGYRARIAVLLALMVALLSGSVDMAVYPLVLLLMMLQKLHTVTVYSSVPLLRRRIGSLLDSNARVTRMATAGSLVGAITGSIAAYAFAGSGAIAVAMGLAIAAMRLVPDDGFMPHRTVRIETQGGNAGAVVASGAAFALVKLAIGAMVITLGSAAANSEHDGRVVAAAALLAYAVGGGVGTVVVPRLAQIVSIPTAMSGAATVAAMAAVAAAAGAAWQSDVLVPTMSAFIGLLGSFAHQHRDHVIGDTVPCRLLRRTFAQWDGVGQLAWVAGAVLCTFTDMTLTEVVGFAAAVGLVSALVAVVVPQRRAGLVPPHRGAQLPASLSPGDLGDGRAGLPVAA